MNVLDNFTSGQRISSYASDMKNLSVSQMDVLAVEAASAINIGCDTNDFEKDSAPLRWRFEHPCQLPDCDEQTQRRNQCPQAFFVNCTQITKEVALQVLRGKHLLLIGDSLTRYQYLNLVQFLTTGYPLWPNKSDAAFENIHQWPSVNAFFQGTNNRLGGQEVCDCFRGPGELK